ncbi:DUF1667 domain-containing protein [Mollicutes bacterium LVI A0039]|nr:DUF1667 domain-containing protein [Mollicutes bacterium LVI A0039]
MEKVCIVCPRGCHLQYEYQGEELIITNNGCKRGPEYLTQELILPKRMLTTTVKVNGGEIPVVPVYASEYVAKDDVDEFIGYLKTIEIDAPVLCDTKIVWEINGKPVSIFTSRDIAKKV